MRLSLLLPCVVLAGMIGVSLFAQTDREPGPTPSDSGGLFERVPQPVEATADHDLDDGHTHDDAHTHEAEEAGAVLNATVEEQKLRQQYRELIEEKSAHMDRSALREAISRAESDIDELKADAKLQEAKQLLLDLVKTHPETSAAQTARMMLQARPLNREILPIDVEPYDPLDEETFSPSTNTRTPAGFIAPADKTPDILAPESAPFYDPGTPEKPKVPVKSRPRKKGQSNDPFRSPFGSPARDDVLDG